ncbi:DDE-type integrase/transposase/recombinase [Streptomyces werraensis]|uniref:DDE-type integrase/transposase/recombinase n=1 Tax=Streptomyces werraensis TaxID=68284 RepID=UPI0036FD1FB1
MTSPVGVSRSRPPTTARPSTSGTMFPGPLCRAKPFRRVAPHTPGMAFVRINGERKYLWRAVEQDATCWTSSCRTAGTKAAARRFFRRLLKRTGAVPRVVITDQRWEETTARTATGCGGCWHEAPVRLRRLRGRRREPAGLPRAAGPVGTARPRAPAAVVPCCCGQPGRC